MREGNSGHRLYFPQELWLGRFGSMFPVCFFFFPFSIVYCAGTQLRFFFSELPPATPDDEAHNRSEEERRSRNLVEKKTVINLIEAFS